MDNTAQPERPPARVRRVKIGLGGVTVPPTIRQPSWRLLFRWTLANTLGAILGALLAQFLTGGVVTSSFTLGELDIAVVIQALLTGLILGAIIGVAEWLVLTDYVAVTTGWILATSLGWAVALVANAYAISLIPESSNMARAIMVGACVGLAQATVLRNWIKWSSLWVVGCVLAWSIMIEGMVIISRLLDGLSPFQGDLDNIAAPRSPISLLLGLIWLFGSVELVTGIVLLLLLNLTSNARRSASPDTTGQAQGK